MLKRKPDEEVAFAVNLYYYCKTFRALPHEGGALDQDAYYMMLLRLVDEAYAEKDKMERDKQEAEAKYKAGRRR